jgi:hypothetical protein
VTLVSAPRVFLSYARKDGEEFATALRRRLAADEPEITLWHDRAEMEGGVGWWAQIEAALDQVKFLVIVVTPRAIASEVTRTEWRYARQRGVIVYPVKGVPDAELDYAALPAWMRKAHFFDIGRFTSDGWRDAKEWQTFVNYLKSDRQPLRVPFMAPDLPHGFVPRDREFEQLLQLVLNPARESPVSITTALQGAGGYGKTTLAIALCHDDRIVDAFDDGVLWTSLGQTPRLVDEVARLYEALTGQRPAFVDATQAAARLAEKLEHRNCLMVVDDVWDRAHLDPFLKGGAQCAAARDHETIRSGERRRPCSCRRDEHDRVNSYAGDGVAVRNGRRCQARAAGEADGGMAAAAEARRRHDPQTAGPRRLGGWRPDLRRARAGQARCHRVRPGRGGAARRGGSQNGRGEPGRAVGGG